MGELGQLETLYNTMHGEGVGVQVISYNGWDDAYTQYDSKYNYYGHTLPQDFLDAETNDFYTWRIAGSGWYSQTSVVGTTGKIYWMEAYSFNDAEIKAALRRTINGDTAAPYCHDAYPAPGSHGADVDTNIYVTMTDDGSGIDRDSVKMTVTVPSGNVTGDLSLGGSFVNYELAFDPTSSLPAGVTVTVKVEGKDLFNNNMTPYQWTFMTGGSNVEPMTFGRIKALYK